MFAQPVARAFDVDDDGVVEQAVEQGGGDDGVAEQFAPFGEAAVGGEDHGAFLVPGVDELEEQISYLPVSQDGAVLFFQLINARHERASTVLTSNKGFEEWGSVLGDEVMAAALVDRLLHHCHIVNIRGNSYRMREHQDLLRSASEDRQGVAS